MESICRIRYTKYGCENWSDSYNETTKRTHISAAVFKSNKTKEKAVERDINSKDGYKKTKNDKTFKAPESPGEFGPIKSNDEGEVNSIDLTTGVSVNAGLVGVEASGGIEFEMDNNQPVNGYKK